MTVYLCISFVIYRDLEEEKRQETFQHLPWFLGGKKINNEFPEMFANN